MEAVVSPDEWLMKLRLQQATGPQLERAAIRSGANAVAFARRSPMESRVLAVGNRMRVSGRVNTPQVTSAIVSGLDAAVEKAWS